MTHNPSRGCGKKKKGGYYIESEGSPGGMLAAWTWLLDDGGVDESNILYWQPPPRQVVAFRPLESIALREIYRYEEPRILVMEDSEDFNRLNGKVPHQGILDHVGADNYSVRSFANELREHGPSRRVTPQFATAVGQLLDRHGAVPLLFTHLRIPIFQSEEARRTAWDMATETIPYHEDGGDNFTPTWREDGWGIYAADYGGWRSGMIQILAAVDRIDKHWRENKDYAVWQEAKEFFSSLTYVERPFGATWITTVTYTLPENSEPDPAAEQIPGLRYLDLDADEIVGYSRGGY